MKKFAPIAAIVLLGAMFTSCKKDYTCNCSINGTQYATYTFHTTKSKAKDACNASASSGGMTLTCSLD